MANSIVNANITTTVTMTSLELVDYINSQRKDGEAELRHDHFMAKVPKVLGEDAPKFLGTSFYKGNGSAMIEREIYTFPKRESCLMAMSYSYDLQAKVFDKMTALEQLVIKGTVVSKPTAIQPSKEFRALYGIARLIGLDKNVATISANQAVFKMTGTNVLNLLGHTHLDNEEQTLYYTPTEIGEMMGGISARKVNLLLAEAGLQCKKGEHWTPMTAAEGFCRVLDTGKKHGDGTMVQQVKWAAGVLNLIKKEQAA